MIFRQPDPSKPKFPLMAMNKTYIHCPEFLNDIYIITENNIKNRKFSENLIIIDIDCRRFEVIDIVKIGRNFNPLHWSYKYKMYKTKYIFGEPVQLTFDQARDEYVELVCNRRWYRETYESEVQFRKRNAEYANMAELLKSVGYKGNWLL